MPKVIKEIDVCAFRGDDKAPIWWDLPGSTVPSVGDVIYHPDTSQPATVLEIANPGSPCPTVYAELEN